MTKLTVIKGGRKRVRWIKPDDVYDGLVGAVYDRVRGADGTWHWRRNYHLLTLCAERIDADADRASDGKPVRICEACAKEKRDAERDKYVDDD